MVADAGPWAFHVDYVSPFDHSKANCPAPLQVPREVRAMLPTPAAPQQVTPLLALATQLLRAGQPADAIAPLLAGCYYDLVRCRPVTSDDDGLLQRMEAALATPGLEAAQRVRLHLGLGKAADDLGDYCLAMKHFDAADAVRRISLSFDSDAFAIEIAANFQPWTHVPNQVPLDMGVTTTTSSNQNMTPAAKALQVAWLKKKKQIFAGKLTKPDAEDPETVNHLNWYMSTGFTRPYPGEKTVRPPSEFTKAAPKGEDLDD
jgi:hypothetical protein